MMEKVSPLGGSGPCYSDSVDEGFLVVTHHRFEFCLQSWRSLQGGLRNEQAISRGSLHPFCLALWTEFSAGVVG